MARRVILLYRGDAIELPLGVITVGRDLECEMRLHDPAVSRRHLRFIHRRNEVFVEDLSSTNGTLLNGRPVFQPIRLHDGDKLKLGGREIDIKIAADSGFDELEPQTLVVGPDDKGHTDDEPESVPAKKTRRAETVITPRSTAKIPRPEALAPPAEQRCPQCAAVISVQDENCASCGYTWGDFSPRSTTQVGGKTLRERRYERHDVVVPLIYRSNTLEVEAQTRDLSLGGVFVCTSFLDTIGTECELTILIDGGPPITLHGSVKRVVAGSGEGNPAGLGVEFSTISSEATRWLRSVVSRQQREAANG